MSDQNNDYQKIQEIFFQHYARSYKRIKENNSKFAYYTSAEVAFSILKNKKLWMRNATVMNDYMEFEHGVKCLDLALESEHGQFFKDSLNNCFPNIADEIEREFKNNRLGIKYDSFITCFSEHDSAEDLTGRLSMWRAYGSRSGVALIFKNANWSNLEALNITASPVAYFTENDIADELKKIGDAIQANLQFISSLGHERLKFIAQNMFKYAALCNKHPGFKEELEWRIISSPRIYPSKHLPIEIEVVRGVPQPITKIPLSQKVGDDILGLELLDLLDKVIIGPCEFPNIEFQAFCEILSAAGFENPHEKIIISNIPLRHLS